MLVVFNGLLNGTTLKLYTLVNHNRSVSDDWKEKEADINGIVI